MAITGLKCLSNVSKGTTTSTMAPAAGFPVDTRGCGPTGGMNLIFTNPLTNTTSFYFMVIGYVADSSGTEAPSTGTPGANGGKYITLIPQQTLGPGGVYVSQPATYVDGTGSLIVQGVTTPFAAVVAMVQSATTATTYQIDWCTV
jgi:hypothetical protein